MNRIIPIGIVFLFVGLALTPPASANTSGDYTYEVCREDDLANIVGQACARASVHWDVVTCWHTGGEGADAVFSCKVRFKLSLTTYGWSTCSWTYMAPPGEVSDCLLFAGLTEGSPALGERTYDNIKVGTRTVWEPGDVCVDYGTLFPRCEPFEVPVLLPNLQANAFITDPIPMLEALVESVNETAHSVVNHLDTTP